MMSESKLIMLLKCVTLFCAKNKKLCFERFATTNAEDWSTLIHKRESRRTKTYGKQVVSSYFWTICLKMKYCSAILLKIQVNYSS